MRNRAAGYVSARGVAIAGRNRCCESLAELTCTPRCLRSVVIATRPPVGAAAVAVVDSIRGLPAPRRAGRGGTRRRSCEAREREQRVRNLAPTLDLPLPLCFLRSTLVATRPPGGTAAVAVVDSIHELHAPRRVGRGSTRRRSCKTREGEEKTRRSRQCLGCHRTVNASLGGRASSTLSIDVAAGGSRGARGSSGENSAAEVRFRSPQLLRSNSHRAPSHAPAALVPDPGRGARASWGALRGLAGRGARCSVTGTRGEVSFCGPCVTPPLPTPLSPPIVAPPPRIMTDCPAAARRPYSIISDDFLPAHAVVG